MTTPFQQYQSGKLDGKDVKPVEQFAEAIAKIEVDREDFQTKAKILVCHDFNKTFFPDNETFQAKPSDFYVVWFAKVLGNWKALISTDSMSGQYWEVTYDGEKKHTYVDHYVKRSNEAISDFVYATLS